MRIYHANLFCAIIFRGDFVANVVTITGVKKLYKMGSETVAALNGVDLKIDAGEFVASKFLAWRQCVDLADEFLVNMLEAYGIPVLRRYAGDGSFGKVVLGMSGTGAELFVPETLYDTAKELMEAEIATEDEL